ncbi:MULTISPECIES: hypothetical protein [Xanthomonas]|uniref:Uncharacterized protein n=3 Tax=Xanthomonas TaxID=338 RepID=A0A6V7FM12_9XANT|nr:MULTISPECIES: hypothetical protein [Xanthomonas]ETC84395.1 secreted protein [Xanthomonas hortorum pv. carotae str. M081]MBG3849864.1 hypothetical protein [Xanthomonas hortorum pv. carotae]MCE4373111.1 hypothetical protein [Xanthomonas hortorum pv. hederae]MDC8639973.1 hypothetical protein [Xanthomonas hortorum pv. hederae]MDV2453602.1 hypothetical protein [Xanthomonas hortorum NBC5720]
MLLRRARLLHPLLRLMALAVLVMGVLVAPVACALGDVHALAHDQMHLEDTAPHGHDGADEGDAGERDGAGLMHALMHSGYCHGQNPAVLPALAWLPLSTHTQAQPVAVFAHYRSQLSETGLRPPIAA